MVLLPCSRCCQPAGQCVCSCQCCECSADQEQNPDPWTFALTLPFGTPSGNWNPTNGSRQYCQDYYTGLVEFLADCGISRRWSSQAACVSALIAAEKAAILAAGSPYTYDLFSGGGYPTGAEPTSSLTLTERQQLWDALNFGPLADPLHELLSGAVSLADEAAIDAYLEDLFGSSGPLDATFAYHGYCSDCAAVSLDGSYYFGWSIPYRDGEPFTIGDLEAICPLGAPWSMADPPLAYGRAHFFDDTTPLIRSVVLASSTGDAVADRLIETGTRALSVVEDELGYALPEWTKTIVVERDECADLGVALPAGRKTVTITIDYVSGATHKRWELIVTFQACTNREDTESGDGLPMGLYSYSLWFDDDYPNNPVDQTTKITSTASIRPYIDEADCDTLRSGGGCAGGLWQLHQLADEGLAQACCDQGRGIS